MPSPQMMDFWHRCRAMPPRMPIEKLKEMRRTRNESDAKAWPLLAGVTTEKVVMSDAQAVWYRPQKADQDRLVVYFHGGGFMWSSAEAHGGVISRVAHAAKANTLALDYKVAPFSPFPAQINEGVSLYKSLLSLGHAPHNIAFVGDSAGGGLVLSVLYALKRDGIMLPACATISSAYIDLTNSGESIEWVTMDPCVSREGLDICVDHYLQGADPRDPLASPIFADVSGFPPILVQVGSRERLLSDSTRFAAKADAASVKVELEVYDGCVHLWHWWVPDAPEAAAAIDSIAAFVSRHTGANQ